MSTLREIHRQAMELAKKGLNAREMGDIDFYIKMTTEAFHLEKKAALMLFTELNSEPTRSVLFRSAATLAFNCGLLEEAEHLIHCALSGNPFEEIKIELKAILSQIEVAKLDIQTAEEVRAFSYLTVLRDKAINLKVQPKGEKHSKAIFVENIIDCLKNIKVSFLNFVRVNFEREFDTDDFKNYDAVKIGFLKEANPLCVDLNWASFGISIVSDTVIMSKQYSDELNRWKQGIFENYKNEVILPNYNSEEFISEVTKKYSVEERQFIFSNIVETFKESTPYKVSLVDKGFTKIIKEYKPISKPAKEVLFPKSPPKKEEEKKLYRTFGLATSDSGRIKKDDVIETRQIDYAEFRYDTLQFIFRDLNIYLKEPYEFKMIYDHGKFLINDSQLDIDASSTDIEETKSQYFGKIIELYANLIKVNQELSVDEKRYMDVFEKYVFSRNW